MYTDIDFVKDTFYGITLLFAEKFGPTKIKLYWESDSLDYQIIPSTYLYNVLYSSNTPVTFTVIPDTTNATTTALSNDDYMYASVNVQETLTIYARDSYSNL